jgi:hypothetical protein
MRKMKNIILYILLPVTILMGSCKKKDEDAKVSQTISKIDISGAKILFFTEENGGKGNRLMKIKSDGTIETVKMLDQSGNEMKEYPIPQVLSNANLNFLLLSTSGTSNVYPDQGFLVKKQDGSITSLSNYGVPYYENRYGRRNNKVNLTDVSDNIYYRGIKGGGISVVKLNTVNPSYVTGQIITPSDERVNDFDLDVYGNVLYDAFNTSTNVFRIKKSTGGLVNMPSNFLSEYYWIGTDGNFNYNVISGSDINSSNFDQISDVFDFKKRISTLSKISLKRTTLYTLPYSDKLIAITDSKIYELENSTNTPKEITSVPVSNIKVVGKSLVNGDLYIVGDNGGQTILKIDLNNNYSYTKLLTSGKYDIYDMEVFEDGTVYFSALRMSDSKNVFVKIDDAGTETLLNETLNQKGIFMEKATEYIP